MRTLFIYIIASWLMVGLNAYAQDTTVVNKCLECHKKLAEKRIVHKPVNDKCEACHQSNGSEHPKEDVEGFILTKKVPELCYSCHDEKEILKEKVHPPLKEGDCFSCHDIHSSKNDHLLSAKAPGLCYSCHTDLQKTVTESQVKHLAMDTLNSCMNCHSPHSSDEKKMQLKPQPEACFSCHDKTVKVGDHIIPNMKSLVETSKFVHGAIDNNGCSVCHNPHASENKYLLTKAFPSGNYSAASKTNYDLCVQCHESTLWEDAMTTESTGFRDGDKNLHFVHVNKEKGRSCINCHNVHASNNLFLIADKVEFGEWEMPIKYTKLPKGGTCAPGCHTEKKYER